MSEKVIDKIIEIVKQPWFTLVVTAILTAIVIVIFIANFGTAKEADKKRFIELKGKKDKEIENAKKKINASVAKQHPISSKSNGSDSQEDADDFSKLPKSEQLGIAKIEHENNMKLIKERYKEKNKDLYVPGSEPNDDALSNSYKSFANAKKQKNESEQKEANQKKLASIEVDKDAHLTQPLTINGSIELSRGTTIYPANDPQYFIIDCNDPKMEQNIKDKLLIETEGLPYVSINKETMAMEEPLSAENFIRNTINSANKYEVIDKNSKFLHLIVNGRRLSIGDIVAVSNDDNQQIVVISKNLTHFSINSYSLTEEQIKGIFKKKGLKNITDKINGATPEEYWLDKNDYGIVMKIVKISDEHYRLQLQDKNFSVSHNIVTQEQFNQNKKELLQNGIMPRGHHFNKDFKVTEAENPTNIKDYWVDKKGDFCFIQSDGQLKILPENEFALIGNHNRDFVTQKINSNDSNYVDIKNNNIYFKYNDGDADKANQFAKIYAQEFLKTFNSGEMDDTRTNGIKFLSHPINQLTGNVTGRPPQLKDIAINYDKKSDALVIGNKTGDKFTAFDFESGDLLSFKEIGLKKHNEVVDKEQQGKLCHYNNPLCVPFDNDADRNNKMNPMPNTNANEQTEIDKKLKSIGSIATRHKFTKTIDNKLYIWNGIDITSGFNSNAIFANGSTEKQRRSELWNDIVELRADGYDLKNILPEKMQNIELYKNQSDKRIIASYDTTTDGKKVFTYVENIDEQEYKGPLRLDKIKKDEIIAPGSKEKMQKYIPILVAMIKKFGEKQTICSKDVYGINFYEDDDHKKCKFMFLYENHLMIKNSNDKIQVVLKDGTVSNKLKYKIWTPFPPFKTVLPVKAWEPTTKHLNEEIDNMNKTINNDNNEMVDLRYVVGNDDILEIV